MKKEKWKQYVSVIILFHDDVAYLLKFLAWVDKQVSEVFEKYEIIIVNNSSESIDKNIEANRWDYQADIRLIDLAWRHTREFALQAGIDFSIGDFIYEVHNNYSFYDNNIFAELFNQVNSGNDVVLAVPEETNFINASFYKILNFFSQLPFQLSTETIVLASRRAINSVLKHKQMTWQRKVLYKMSWFWISEVFFSSKKVYYSQDSFSEKWKLALNLLFNFTNLAFTLPIIFALFFLLISGVIGFYTLYVYFTLESVVPGWTTQMLFLSGAFSGIFFILSFIVYYLSLLFSEVHPRDSYTVKTIRYK